MAKKKRKKRMNISFPRFLRFVFILLIALIIFYSYYLSTEGILLEQIKNTSLSIYQWVITLIKKNPSIFIGLISYGLVFYIGYLVGKKRS